jgi:hypothetical protein
VEPVRTAFPKRVELMEAWSEVIEAKSNGRRVARHRSDGQISAKSSSGSSYRSVSKSPVKADTSALAALLERSAKAKC